jgi:hypothetical protein
MAAGSTSCEGIDLLAADACWTHRGTTEPGGVRASCGRDDSKIQDEQVGRGSCSHRESPSLSAMKRSSTTPRLPPGASFFLGARACDRAASRSGALPRPAGSEEPAVGGLFDLIKCPLELRCLIELAAGAPAAARGKRLKTPPRKRGRSDGRWVCEQSRGALRAAPQSSRLETCSLSDLRGSGAVLSSCHS